MGLIILFALLNGIYGYGTGIDNWAHFGGFLTGLMIAPLLIKGPEVGESQVIEATK